MYLLNLFSFFLFPSLPFFIPINFPFCRFGTFRARLGAFPCPNLPPGHLPCTKSACFVPETHFDGHPCTFRGISVPELASALSSAHEKCPFCARNSFCWALGHVLGPFCARTCLRTVFRARKVSILCPKLILLGTCARFGAFLCPNLPPHCLPRTKSVDFVPETHFVGHLRTFWGIFVPERAFALPSAHV